VGSPPVLSPPFPSPTGSKQRSAFPGFRNGPETCLALTIFSFLASAVVRLACCKPFPVLSKSPRARVFGQVTRFPPLLFKGRSSAGRFDFRPVSRTGLLRFGWTRLHVNLVSAPFWARPPSFAGPLSAGRFRTPWSRWPFGPLRGRCSHQGPRSRAFRTRAGFPAAWVQVAGPVGAGVLFSCVFFQ